MNTKTLNTEVFKDNSNLRVDFTSPARQINIHSNDFWELLYIYEGQGSLYLDAIQQDINAGVFLLIKPGKKYALTSPDKKDYAPARICSCIFTQEYLDKILPAYYDIFKSGNYSLSDILLGRRPRAVCIHDDDAQNIHHILWLMAHEYNHFKIGSEQIIQSSLLNLLIHATRLYDYQLNNIPPTISTNQSLEELKKYIRANFSYELSLEALASQVHLSREHLCRRFKAYTGQTISAFLLEVRMERAKKMLHNPRNSITDISEYCGYKTMGNFQRAFKKYTGISPREYRKYCSS